MSKTNSEIKCLARLDELTTSNWSVMEFLIQEGLMSMEERKVMNASADVSKALQGHLAKLKGKQLQLIEYEWVLLPDERLKLTLVTDRNNREFSYNF